MDTMHRLLLAFAFICFLPGSSLSQILNAGFEDWTSVNPDNWFTTNAPPTYTNVVQSSTAHTGASAVQGTVINLVGFLIEPVIQSGIDARGFPYSGRPASFSGFYQFFPQGGDQFGINVILFAGGVNGTAVAFAAAELPTTVASYTAFDLPFSYVSGSNPDTCVIQFLITGPTPGPNWHEGSYFLLDDISFSGTVSVDEGSPGIPAATALLQNYPNPFNPKTTIRFDLAGSGMTTLSVYDVLGNEVATLLHQYLTPGRHEVAFDGTGLASGVYLYMLRTGAFVQTRKFILQK